MGNPLKGRIDPASLSVTDEPYRGRLRKETSKYAEVFAQVQPNKRLRCPKGTAARIASQYRKWLEKTGKKDPVVRCVEDYGDGAGGVWWVQEPKKPQTVWQQLERKAA